jgi:hypothetical protein
LFGARFTLDAHLMLLQRKPSWGGQIESSDYDPSVTNRPGLRRVLSR